MSLKDGLTIKDNWQIFPIKSRGIDFVGYVANKGYTLLRRSTKKRMKNKISKIDSIDDEHDMGCV